MKEKKVIQHLLHEVEKLGGTAESGFDAEGRWQNVYVQGVKTKVYHKYFTGTTDADNQTSVAHGENWDKILHASGNIKNTTFSLYAVYGYGDAVLVNDKFSFLFVNASILFNSVGANLQGENYRIRIDYTL